MPEPPRPLSDKELEDWDRWSRREIAWKGEDVQRLLATIQSMKGGRQVVAHVPHGSDLYREVIALRHKVLREPLGLHFTEEQLAAEASHIHLALMVEGQVAACLYLIRETDTRMRVRQVAVDPALQGTGLGKALALASERIAAQFGAREFVLDARETAIPFYEKLGYTVYGEPFEQSTLPHRAMRKNLG